MSKIFKIILVNVVVIFFIGCAGGNISLPSISHSKLTQPIIAEGVINMPKDAAQVILAVSAKIIKSNKRIRDVIFQESFRSRLTDAKLFRFDNAILTSYNSDVDFKRLSADLFFKDSIGRSVAYSIGVAYSVNRGKINISNLKVTDKFTNVSDTVCFILPAQKYLRLNVRNIPRNFYKLYRFAARNAITPEQAQRYRGKSKWAIMVFVLNRMSKSATFSLGVSDNKNDYDKGDTTSTKYINYKGWRVGIITAKFHLMQPDSMKKLYAKAIYKPGKENNKSTFFQKSKLIGLYRIR